MDALVTLRRRDATAFIPLYVTEGAGVDWQAVTDGLWPGSGRASEDSARQAALQERHLAGHRPETPDERLLCYFGMRPEATLAPLVDPRSDALYRYPLLEAYRDGEEAPIWLSTLLRRGRLEQTEVLDRTRHCRRCHSGHLNYVDVCPECDAVDIVANESLHCFVCGHVGQRDRFTREGALVCPNCYTRLRHIGVDYDRPLETHACNQCMASFSEPKVLANCLSCGHGQEPSDLNVVTVGHYRLTAQTRLLAANGGIAANWASSLGEFRLMPPALFANILDWQMDVARRYQSHLFSLVGVNLGDLDSLIAVIGEGRALQLLDSLSDRLSELLRSSDLVGRTLDTQLWLLLPGTPAANLSVVIERLRNLEKLTDEDIGLTLSITAITAPEGLEEGEDARLLLARLGDGDKE